MLRQYSRTVKVGGDPNAPEERERAEANTSLGDQATWRLKEEGVAKAQVSCRSCATERRSWR